MPPKMKRVAKSSTLWVALAFSVVFSYTLSGLWPTLWPASFGLDITKCSDGDQIIFSSGRALCVAPTVCTCETPVVQEIPDCDPNTQKVAANGTAFFCLSKDAVANGTAILPDCDAETSKIVASGGVPLCVPEKNSSYIVDEITNGTCYYDGTNFECTGQSILSGGTPYFSGLTIGTWATFEDPSVCSGYGSECLLILKISGACVGSWVKEDGTPCSTGVCVSGTCTTP